MKNHHIRIEKFKSIAQLLGEYQTIFAAIQHDSNRVVAFKTIVDELDRLNMGLEVPLSVIIQQRVVLNTRIKQDVIPALARGLSMAKSLNDATMTNTLDFYFKQVRKKSNAATSSQAAKVILDYIGEHETEAATAGFSADRIAAIEQMKRESDGMREQAKAHASVRHVDRNQMRRLASEATNMLTNELDWLLTEYKTTEPVLYERYSMLRQRKKRTSKAEVHTDVSGMVTDQATGAAVQGALVYIVDSEGYETNSDVDGYFVVDELEPGAYQLRCSAPGYQQTSDVAFTIAKGESLQVNFSLMAQQAVA
ncbi:MAG: hypothetical protein FD155_3298 [Bacteroidetes bacterium]|nr:MAG: hypothetical protein FD155_3298 [Bacteroidota bacterium]